MELKLSLAMFVARFHVQVDTQRMPQVSTPDDFIDTCTSYTTLHRKAGIHLRFTPRVGA